MASTMKVSFSTNSGVRMKSIDKAKLAVLFLVGIWAYSFKDNLTTLFYSYTDNNYENHGFIALACFAILYLSQARTLSRTPIQSSQLGLLGLLFVTILWAIANITNSANFELISCLAILPMIFFTAFGWQAVKKTYYALAFIFCALPIGKMLGEVAANSFFTILVKALSWISKDIYWQNEAIEFNGVTFDITLLKQALQNTMLLFTLTLFLSHYVTKSLFKRILIGILALCAPIFLLLISQVIIIYFNITSTYTQDNVFIYFIAGMGCLLALAIGMFGKAKRNKPFNIYSDNSSWSGRDHNGRWIKPTIVSCCILLALPFATANLKNHILNYQGEILLELPNKISNWQEIPTPLQPADKHILIKQYQQSYPIAIDLYAKFFEKAIVKEPADLNNFLGSNWRLIKSQVVTTNILENPVSMEEKLYSDENQYQLVWSFYNIHQKIYPKYSYAIVADNWYTLTKSARRSSLITLAIKFNGNELESSREQLQDFLTNLWPNLPQISNPPRKLN